MKYINVQINYDVNHRNMKMIRNNKLFPSLNVINGKTTPCASKGGLRHYHHQSDPKLGPGIVAIRRTPCIFYTCTAILSISWVPKTKRNS